MQPTRGSLSPVEAKSIKQTFLQRRVFVSLRGFTNNVYQACYGLLDEGRDDILVLSVVGY